MQSTMEGKSSDAERSKSDPARSTSGQIPAPKPTIRPERPQVNVNWPPPMRGSSRLPTAALTSMGQTIPTLSIPRPGSLLDHARETIGNSLSVSLAGHNIPWVPLLEEVRHITCAMDGSHSVLGPPNMTCPPPGLSRSEEKPGVPGSSPEHVQPRYGGLQSDMPQNSKSPAGTSGKTGAAILPSVSAESICQKCGKGIPPYEKLAQYLALHAYLQNMCNTCQRQSVREQSEVGKGATKPFKCHECGKGFTQKGGLMQHAKLHTGEKEHRCFTCGKSFTQLSTLKQHERLHTGEKPFNCYECGKAFTQKSGLQQHVRLHTGEKPYQCQICDRAFTQQSILQQHIRIHTGEKPYTCEQCGKAFRQKIGLVQHTRTHTGLKPFVCGLCGKGFTQRSGLEIHYRQHDPPTSATTMPLSSPSVLPSSLSQTMHPSRDLLATQSNSHKDLSSLPPTLQLNRDLHMGGANSHRDLPSLPQPMQLSRDLHVAQPNTHKDLPGHPGSHGSSGSM